MTSSFYQKIEKEFEERFLPSSLKWKDAIHCTCCSTAEEYKEIKSFIFRIVSEVLEEKIDSMPYKCSSDNPCSRFNIYPSGDALKPKFCPQCAAEMIYVEPEPEPIVERRGNFMKHVLKTLIEKRLDMKSFFVDRILPWMILVGVSLYVCVPWPWRLFFLPAFWPVGILLARGHKDWVEELKVKESSISEAHETKNGYCCACGYDIAGFEQEISETLSEMLQEKKKELVKKVSLLRQALNEDRITDPKRMVDDAYLLDWLK